MLTSRESLRYCNPESPGAGTSVRGNLLTLVRASKEFSANTTKGSRSCPLLARNLQLSRRSDHCDNRSNRWQRPRQMTWSHFPRSAFELLSSATRMSHGNSSRDNKRMRRFHFSRTACVRLPRAGPRHVCYEAHQCFPKASPYGTRCIRRFFQDGPAWPWSRHCH